MALGDRVIVVYDLGAGKTREEVVQAGSAGGTVSVVVGPSMAIVTETTRSGRPIRSVRVPVERLVALVENPRGR